MFVDRSLPPLWFQRLQASIHKALKMRRFISHSPQGDGNFIGSLRPSWLQSKEIHLPFPARGRKLRRYGRSCVGLSLDSSPIPRKGTETPPLSDLVLHPLPSGLDSSPIPRKGTETFWADKLEYAIFDLDSSPITRKGTETRWRLMPSSIASLAWIHLPFPARGRKRILKTIAHPNG